MEGGGDRRVLHGPDLCDPCDRRSPDALAYGRRIAGGRAGLLFDRRISLFLFEPDGGPARSRRLFVRPKHGLRPADVAVRRDSRRTGHVRALQMDRPGIFPATDGPGDRDLRGKRMGRESGRVGRYDRGENDGEPALRRVQRRGYDDYLRRTARPDRIVVRQTPRRPVRRCEQRTKRHDAPAIRRKTTARC